MLRVSFLVQTLIIAVASASDGRVKCNHVKYKQSSTAFSAKNLQDDAAAGTTVATPASKGTTQAPGSPSFSYLFHNNNASQARSDIEGILNMRSPTEADTYTTDRACVYVLFRHGGSPQIRYNDDSSNGNAHQIGTKAEQAVILNVDDLWNTSSRMSQHCNETSLKDRHYTGVAFATMLTLGDYGKKNYDVLSVFWMCCIDCQKRVEGLEFGELRMALTLGYAYTHLLPMNMRFKLDNTVEMMDPTMDYQPARCVQKFGRVIVGDYPVGDILTRTQNNKGTFVRTTHIIDGLKRVKRVEGDVVTYNKTSRRIEMGIGSECKQIIKADMFNAEKTTLQVSCSCRNTDDRCINATFFGDMKMCPKRQFTPADQFLYKGQSSMRFPYTDMRKTDSCNFTYTSRFEASGVLQGTSLKFAECNDNNPCDSWFEQKLKLLDANETAWNNLTWLRCAFISKPGACPMVDVRNATVPQHLSLACRCNDSFCAVKAATMLFGGNLLTTTTTYYGRANGSIIEHFVLEGINAMPVYHLATNGSCDLVMMKISHNTTNCSRVWLDRMYKRFYIDRAFARCVCEDPAKGCDKQRERETAKGLFGLIGQCRNSSVFENYWRRDARYPKGQYDWGPGGIASEDLFLCGQVVHLINYESTVEQNRKFSYLLKKSTWSDVEAITKNRSGFRDTLRCFDKENMPKHEKMYICSCWGVNGTCNDWPALFGRYFRLQLENVHYADAKFKCGDEKCNKSGCFGMHGRVHGSGDLEYNIGCLVPADPTTSNLAKSFERFGRWDTNECKEYAGKCFLLGTRYMCCCEDQKGCFTEGVGLLERMPFQNAAEVNTFGDGGKWRNIHDRMSKQQEDI